MEPIDTSEFISSSAQTEQLRDPNRERFEARALKSLEVMGYIHTREDDNIECDLDKFRHFEFRRFKHDLYSNKTPDWDGQSGVPEKIMQHDPAMEYGKNTVIALYTLFKDRPVCDKNRPDEEPKPLLYIPKNDKDAFDKDKIREAEFHLGMWEMQNIRLPQTYPTMENFQSKVPSHEVSMSAIIYNKNYGSGERDDEGRLLVYKDDRSTRSRVNGQFFLDWGYNGKPLTGQDHGNMNHFRQFIKKYCPNLTNPEVDLLRPIDLNENGAHGVSSEYFPRPVRKNGMWMYNSTRYYIGKSYRDNNVEHLAGTLFVVRQKDGEHEPVLVFDTQLKGVVDTFITPQGTILNDAGNNEFDKWQVSEITAGQIDRYDESGELVKEKVNIAAELPGLMAFRDDCFARGIEAEDMATLSVTDQILIKKEVERLGEKAWGLLEKGGYKSLILFATEYKFGGTDSRIVELAEGYDEQTEALLDAYVYAQAKIDMLHDEVQKRLETVKYSGTRNTVLHFTNSTTHAFRYRMGDFLVAASLGYKQEALEQMHLLAESLDALADVYRGPESKEYKREGLPSENRDATTGQTTFVTLQYINPDGDKLKITIRPEEQYNPQRVKFDQPRYLIKYTDKDGKSVDYRVDYDKDQNFGTSLDLGRQDTPMMNLLQAVGKTHHTEETYSRSLEDPRSFRRVMTSLAGILGYNGFS
jgi:hypothetical protein